MSLFTECLSMHGYALYVWPAYGIVSVALITKLCLIKRQKKRIHQQLRSWTRGERS